MLNKRKQYFFRCLVVFFLVAILYISINIQSQEVIKNNSTSADKKLVINEVLSENSGGITDKDGNFTDWIEIYNYSGEDINLKGYGLSQDLDDLFLWEFPDIIIKENSYLVVKCSGKSELDDLDNLSTNFKINKKGEAIALTHKDGEIIDELNVPSLKENLSFGRKPDGGEQFAMLNKATPGEANKVNIIQYVNVVKDLEVPRFSSDGGYYTNDIKLELTTDDKDMKIYYTLDGSEPTLKSKLYREPISITSREGQPNKLANIPTSDKYNNKLLTIGQEEVYKGTVVRARTCKNGVLSEKIITNTYFINPQYSLPIVSITTDEDNLFGYENGIYVPGLIYDKWLRKNNFDIEDSFMSTANYSQKGEEWERKAHLEFFKTDGSKVVSEDVGIRVHGNKTRENPVKSLSVYARKKYNDTGFISYDFFDWEEKNITTNTDFKNIILRTSGNDYNKTMFRDALMQNLVQETSLDTQEYRPAILFINGEYWGIHNIREKQNESYISQHYNVDKDDVQIVEPFIESYYKKSENKILQEYHKLMDFIEENDMSIEENYEYVKSKMDIENFIDYIITQLYSGNTDWATSNTKVWKIKDRTNSASNYDDGKWRFLLYDTDFAFGLYKKSAYDQNTLEVMINRINKNLDRPAIPLKSLLYNEEFKNQFLATFDKYMDTIFSSENVLDKIDEMASIIQPEMEEHINRWKSNCTFYGKIYEKLTDEKLRESEIDFVKEVDKLREFATNRPKYIKQYIYEYCKTIKN